MHSEIDIKVNGQSMALDPDFSMDVTEENPLFHDVEMHSDPVRVSTEYNRHVFQNIDDPQSHQRPIDMEHLPAQWSVNGIPFRSGNIRIQEDEELDGSFSFNIDETRQSFRDLIGDLECRDVPLYNDERVPIGEKVCDVEAHAMLTVNVSVDIDLGSFSRSYKLGTQANIDPQALGFSYPGRCSGVKSRRDYPDGISVNIPNVTQSFINVSEPYQSVGGKPAAGGWRYCNARVCYAHKALNAEKREDEHELSLGRKILGTIGETKDEIMRVGDHYAQYEDYGPNWVLDADRPQSGICFYVIYFLDCLFAHLGVTFDNSALMKIEDLRRLVFFTTRCKFMTDPTETVQTLGNMAAINKWLSDRGCGGQFEIADPEEKQLQEWTDPTDGKYYEVDKAIDPMGIFKVKSITSWGEITGVSATAKVRTMYATSENFPDESVQTVLDSLEKSFGIRFRYDYQQNKVTAYLLRDVFRQLDSEGNALPPIELPCTLLKGRKLSEKITGVKMKYSSEGERKEQEENVRKAKRDYETDFNYIDYRQDRTVVAEGYSGIASDLKTENVTCYVDLKTANAYRFKISKDLDTANVAYHRLFEVGAFHGIEVGDCSKLNEDHIIELVSDFLPMSFNDVNAYAELKLGSRQPVFAAFIDEDMEHEFVTQRINHPLYSEDLDLYVTEALRCAESYDPSGTDDGNSPLQDIEWGLSIAVMRGGGVDASVINYDYGYDGFGNAKWKTVAGKYAISSDTMDQWGTEYDYNGDSPGDGGGERFSLKIRSWKPFLYYKDSQGKTHVTSNLSLLGQPVSGVSGQTWLMPCNASDAVARRGLADVFMSEYIYFLLQRRKMRLHLLAEPAALVDIPNHWYRRFRIGEFTGFIDRIHYGVSASDGIGEVTIDFYAI